MKKILFKNRNKKGGGHTEIKSSAIRTAKKKRSAQRKAQPMLPIICRPGTEMSTPLYIIGWVLRSLVLFCGVFGLTLFVGDGIGVYGSGRPGSTVSLAACSAVLTMLFSAAAWYKSFWFIPPLAGFIAAVGGLFAVSSNPFLLIWDGIRYVINTAMLHMASLGYTSFGNYLIGADSYHGPESLVRGVGFAVLAAVIAAVLSIALLRRVHTIVAVAVSVIIISPVFIYNLTCGNAGVSMVLIFIFGELSLLIYERKFSNYEAKRIEKRRMKAERKAAKKERRIKAKEESLALDSTALKAYAISLEITGDKKEAKAAKASVYRLDRKSKAAAKKAVKDSKKADKAAKKALRKSMSKEAAAKKKSERAAKSRERAELKKLPKDEAMRRLAAKQAEIRENKEKKREERRLKAESETVERKTLSASGYAGGFAVILAALAVWLPFAAITGNFITIDFINNPVSVVREYVTAYLRGDDIDLNNLGSIAELTPRTLTYDSPEYKQIQMLAVETERADPVYLRGWIGMRFNAASGTWTSASSDDVIEYRRKFAKNFTPDILKTYFLGNMFPTSVMIDKTNPTLRFSDFGFDVRQVNLRRINGSSLIIYAPPTVNSEFGILEYGGLDKNSARYSAYFDGIYSSRFFDRDTYYSTISFTPAMYDPDVADGMEDLSEYFELFLEFTEIIKEAESVLSMQSTEGYRDFNARYGYVSISPDDLTAIDDLFLTECTNRGLLIPTGDSICKRYISMSDEEREKISAFVETEEEYCEWADLKYGGSVHSAVVTELAKEILSDAGYERNTKYNRVTPVYFDRSGNRVNEHDVVMTVINYLKDNYEYTLEPNPYDGENMTVLDSFLTKTKNGYCTHFATAAAALIREYGYSVRYAEGYLVSGFSRDYSEDAPSKYRGYALDENAHAWIEVYYPNLGWVAYETVPEYMSLMYDPRTEDDDAEGGINNTTPPDDNPLPDDADPNNDSESDQPDIPDIPDNITNDEPDEEPIDQLFILMICGICAVSAALVIFAVRFVIKRIMKRAERVVEDRHRHIVTAMDTELLYKQKIDILPIAKEFDDTILRIFDLLGYPPKTGEQYSDYAARLEEDFGGMTDYSLETIFSLVAKTEFGGGLTPDEIYILADFTDRLTVSAYAGLSRLEKIKYRYIKRII